MTPFPEQHGEVRGWRGEAIFQLQGESLVLHDLSNASGALSSLLEKHIGDMWWLWWSKWLRWLWWLHFVQGGGEAPKNLSGRLVAATWYPLLFSDAKLAFFSLWILILWLLHVVEVIMKRCLLVLPSAYCQRDNIKVVVWIHHHRLVHG